MQSVIQCSTFSLGRLGLKKATANNRLSFFKAIFVIQHIPLSKVKKISAEVRLNGSVCFRVNLEYFPQNIFRIRAKSTRIPPENEESKQEDWQQTWAHIPKLRIILLR